MLIPKYSLFSPKDKACCVCMLCPLLFETAFRDEILTVDFVCRCTVHPTGDILPFVLLRCLGSKALWDFSGLMLIIIPVIPWWAKSEKSLAPVPPPGSCNESAILICWWPNAVDSHRWHREPGLWQSLDLSLPEQGNQEFVQLPLLSVGLWFFLLIFTSQWPRCANAPLHLPGGLCSFWAHLWRLHQLFASHRNVFLMPRPLQRRQNSSVKKDHWKQRECDCQMTERKLLTNIFWFLSHAFYHPFSFVLLGFFILR